MDFSKVTSLQIPEGNVTKIEDKEGNILWANINKVAYGVRWNSVNQATTACKRIGNLELHKTLPIQSRFKVCIHKGKDIQYYCNPDDSRFRQDNTGYVKTLPIVLLSETQPAIIEDTDTTVKIRHTITDDIFADYKYLYAFIKVYTDNTTGNICRITKIDTANKTAYLESNNTFGSGDYSVELGCSINGYDGEIGVDTGGKFYQWSVDNDGDNNEVWQSLYKCVPYAREIKRHIIGIDRACVLNVAFNDTKWGWIGGLEANTAVNVINYHTNLRGGSNNSSWDKYLGVDNFRCQLGKARTNIPLATMRNYSQKTDGGQMLYKQIWEAIVWSYVIEYADFDVKKAYNSELTTEGYHQGGLGNGVIEVNDLANYNNNEKIVPNDYTLELGNNTGIKARASRQWYIPVAANHYWNNYDIKTRVIATKSSDNKILTITSTKIFNTDWNIYANANVVGGITKYKITGLTDGQTVVFKREKGNLTITTDGTYDVEWGTGNNQRKIYFGKLQTECNIVIEILSAPAYNIVQNQIAWNVPHWRGFNVFWYGDIWINIDNMLTKYNTTKQKRIWYYTDDITKFSNDITNKEHQIEGLGNVNENWLQEVRINNKGDIIPSKIANNVNYKNSYHWNYTDSSIHTTFSGGRAASGSLCGLLCLTAALGAGRAESAYGFAKVTILDN
ncbi:MAG: hypothetical protein PUJ60_01795 [bacterium]|nr:hypothetical protein [bacterium]MDY4108883.1 hypothetical protein [Bacilli bacterium]